MGVAGRSLKCGHLANHRRDFILGTYIPKGKSGALAIQAVVSGGHS